MADFSDWWRVATHAEKTEVARMVGSSTGYLNQLKNGYRTMSSIMAGNICAVIRDIRRGNRDMDRRFPRLRRGDLNYSCSICPYYMGSSDELD